MTRLAAYRDLDDWVASAALVLMAVVRGAVRLWVREACATRRRLPSLCGSPSWTHIELCASRAPEVRALFGAVWASLDTVDFFD